MKNFRKFKINRIFISIFKIALVLFGLFIFFGTSQAFANEVALDNGFSTDCLEKPTTPNLLSPDNGYMAGKNSAWILDPKMDWEDSETDCPLSENIKYEYESYYDINLNSPAYRSGLLSDSEIPAPNTPDGDYYWRVRAFDGYNWSDWSDVWLLRVDTICPVVEITDPSDGKTVNGIVDIYGTVTDLNPYYYWLVIENSNGIEVAKLDKVNNQNSFINESLFIWDTTDTTLFPDGTYTIKLEAEDAFGNNCPEDSADSISVTVNNNIEEPEGGEEKKDEITIVDIPRTSVVNSAATENIIEENSNNTGGTIGSGISTVSEFPEVSYVEEIPEEEIPEEDIQKKEEVVEKEKEMGFWNKLRSAIGKILPSFCIDLISILWLFIGSGVGILGHYLLFEKWRISSGSGVAKMSFLSLFWSGCCFWWLIIGIIIGFFVREVYKRSKEEKKEPEKTEEQTPNSF